MKDQKEKKQPPTHQKEIRETKSTVQIVLFSIYYWSWGPHISTVYTPSDALLVRMNYH